MRAAKLDLAFESVGPSSQESPSSSHHSDVANIEAPFWPPTARSRWCVDPTGIIWKKALACRRSPPLIRALDLMLKISTLARTSSKSDTPPAMTKWSVVAPQPGPLRFVKRLGQESIDSSSGFPLVTVYSRTLCVSFMWIVTKLVLDMLQPHSADVGNTGPATQVSEPCGRTDRPLL